MADSLEFDRPVSEAVDEGRHATGRDDLSEGTTRMDPEIPRVACPCGPHFGCRMR